MFALCVAVAVQHILCGRYETYVVYIYYYYLCGVYSTAKSPKTYCKRFKGHVWGLFQIELWTRGHSIYALQIYRFLCSAHFRLDPQWCRTPHTHTSYILRHEIAIKSLEKNLNWKLYSCWLLCQQHRGAFVFLVNLCLFFSIIQNLYYRLRGSDKLGYAIKFTSYCFQSAYKNSKYHLIHLIVKNIVK